MPHTHPTVPARTIRNSPFVVSVFDRCVRTTTAGTPHLAFGWNRFRFQHDCSACALFSTTKNAEQTDIHVHDGYLKIWLRDPFHRHRIEQH